MLLLVFDGSSRFDALLLITSGVTPCPACPNTRVLGYGPLLPVSGRAHCLPRSRRANVACGSALACPRTASPTPNTVATELSSCILQDGPASPSRKDLLGSLQSGGVGSGRDASAGRRRRRRRFHHWLPTEHSGPDGSLVSLGDQPVPCPVPPRKTERSMAEALARTPLVVLAMPSLHLMLHALRAGSYMAGGRQMVRSAAAANNLMLTAESVPQLMLLH